MPTEGSTKLSAGETVRNPIRTPISEVFDALRSLDRRGKVYERGPDSPEPPYPDDPGSNEGEFPSRSLQNICFGPCQSADRAVD